MSSLFLQPMIRVTDSAGAVVPGALVYFYLAGTTTPAATYNSPGLTTPNSNPVVANSGGLVGPIYLDPAITYRATFRTSDGVLLDDVSPYSNGPQPASQAQADAGTAGDVFITPTTLRNLDPAVLGAILGYTPADVAGYISTGDIRLNYTPTVLNADSVGFRGAPIVTRDTDYVFVLNDSGRAQRHTSGSGHTWTVPPNSDVAFPLGTVVVLRNVGAGSVTVARGSGVVLRAAGSSVDGNKTLAQWAQASLLKETADTWVISGTGIS